MFLCLNNQDSYLIVINVIDYSVMSCNKSGWVSFSVTKKFFYALFTVTVTFRVYITEMQAVS